MHPIYQTALERAQEISSHTHDLMRAIENANAGRISDTEIERLATQLAAQAKAITDTFDSAPHAEDSPEMKEALLELTADELAIAIKRRDAAVEEEAKARHDQATAAGRMIEARKIHATAQEKTNKAEAKVQAARAAHAAARAKQETAQ